MTVTKFMYLEDIFNLVCTLYSEFLNVLVKKKRGDR